MVALMRWGAASGAALGLALCCLPVLAGESQIDAERCAANQSAGPITFLTAFGYAASPGILDLVAAEQQGFFKALCLDVSIVPGSNHVQLVSAGTAQFAGIGGPSDVLVGRDNGAKVISIATYGNTSIIEMLTMADSGIESVADFAGKTLGFKGAVPPQLRAMLLNAGLAEDAVDWVSVGYDPSILVSGQVQGLAGYKSNEPLLLAASGASVVEWDPADYGVVSSFNSQIVNAEWAEAHPSAVEDFLRASLQGLNWILADESNLDAALGSAAALSQAGYDIEASKARWQAEIALVMAGRDEAKPLAWQSAGQWQAEAELLQRFALIRAGDVVTGAFDNRFIAAIHDGSQLIWPGRAE